MIREGHRPLTFGCRLGTRIQIGAPGVPAYNSLLRDGSRIERLGLDTKFDPGLNISCPRWLNLRKIVACGATLRTINEQLLVMMSVLRFVGL